MSYCSPRRLALRAGDRMMPRRARTLFTSVLVIAWALTRVAALSAQAPIAIVSLTPGWVTFGQVVPKGFAHDGLRVGSLATQTDVKTRWEDGSIRFAVVTAKADAAGDYAISAGAASGPAFVPALPSATVALTINGALYVAMLPADVSNDRWLSGPNVYEARTIVAPASDAGEHPFLRVIFDTRAYSDGKARVDITVENVIDQVGATTVTYDVAIDVGGESVWSKTNVEHYYLTRWRKVFEVGPTPLGAIRPDLTPFNQARALPPYLPLVANVVDRMTDATGAVRPAFDILGPGALNNPMWDHAGRPELAPYPDWTARYLVHKDPAQLAFVLANGDLSGSWPFHLREPQGALCPSPADPLVKEPCGVGPDRFISLDQRPTVWLDDRASTDPIVRPEDRVKGSPMQMHEYGSGIPAPGQSPLGPDLAHQPSLAYVPYLLTGDRYYADEMGFIANYNLIHTYDGDGVRTDTCASCPHIGRIGVIANNEVRGFGWALRNLVDAAAYAPAPEARVYFAAKVRNNLSWLDDNANGQDPATNPLRILWTRYRPETGFISLWEQSYLAFAIDRANAQGFAGGLANRDAIANLQLRLFTGGPEYPRVSDAGCVNPNDPLKPVKIPCDWSAPYLLAVGTVPTATSWDGFTFFTTMKEIADHTIGNPDLQRPYAGFYGPEARLNLMIAMNNQWAGAQDSYDYLYPFIAVDASACSVAFGGDGSADRSDLACRAGWAVDFYPPAPAPAPTNHAPTLATVADQSGEAGESVNLAVSASDPDNDTLTYSAQGLPGTVSIDPVTGIISGTLTSTGSFPVTISVSDATDAAETSFVWRVFRRAAILSPAPNTTLTSSTQAFAWDAGAGVTRTRLDVGSSAGTADILSGQLATVLTEAVANLPVDGRRLFVRLSSEIDGAVRFNDYTYTAFTFVNQPPAIAPVADRTNGAGEPVSLAIAASDPEGTALSFSATGLPAGLTIDAATGVIGGTLLAMGDFTVTVTASDGVLTASTSFVWHVTRPAGLVLELKNPGPQTSRTGDDVLLRLEVVYNQVAVRMVGGISRATRLVSFGARNLPRGLRIRSDGTIRGRIDSSAAGVYQVTVTVTEFTGRRLSQTFQWTVVRR